MRCKLASVKIIFCMTQHPRLSPLSINVTGGGSALKKSNNDDEAIAESPPPLPLPSEKLASMSIADEFEGCKKSGMSMHHWST